MLLARRPVSHGRQVTFVPVETLLCLAASFVVNHRHFGGGTAHQAPEPVSSLARLFSRPPSSVLAKMANLDGSRSHGGRWDVLAGAILRENPDRFTHVYRMLLLAATRVGQHVFAQQVLANCGSRCVFCGLRPAAFGAKKMLLAGHIKPWKDSTPTERLDPRNGLAACPAHDVAFDTGMLAVNGGLRIHVAGSLAEATRTDPLVRQYYGRPPLREMLLLPIGAQAPSRKYLDWHRQKIFVA